VACEGTAFESFGEKQTGCVSRLSGGSADDGDGGLACSTSRPPGDLLAPAEDAIAPVHRALPLDPGVPTCAFEAEPRRLKQPGLPSAYDDTHTLTQPTKY